MSDISAVEIDGKLSVPKNSGEVIEFPVMTGKFALKGSDATFEVKRGKPSPSTEEAKATAKELAALVQMLHGNGWTVDGVEEALLTDPRHTHLRYHRCRRPEIYRIFSKPPTGEKPRPAQRANPAR